MSRAEEMAKDWLSNERSLTVENLTSIINEVLEEAAKVCEASGGSAMKQTIKTGFAVSAFVICAMVTLLFASDYGFSKVDAYEYTQSDEHKAEQELVFSQCVADYRAINKIRGYDSGAMAKCPDVMAGRAVL